ncbi:MAG TPA: cupin domain-containing protein, partial [Planctomycetaceae bacterium]
GSSWVAAGGGDHPWDQEAAAGEPEVGETEERPANIVNVGDLEQERWNDLADAAGSVKSGLNVVTIGPGKLPAPAHSHSAEEEIFVVLEGDGTLELVPSPRARDGGHEEEHHPIRAGHVVARPAGTRIAHAFRGGESGMKVLMYGWRDTNDITYYPRSNKLAFRGVGLIARLEPLDYWDGEEPPG